MELQTMSKYSNVSEAFTVFDVAAYYPHWLHNNLE